MKSFEQHRKNRPQGLKVKIFFKKAGKIFGDSCKKGWYKVKHIRG